MFFLNVLFFLDETHHDHLTSTMHTHTHTQWGQTQLGAAHFQDATTNTVANWIKIGGRAIDSSEDYGYPLGTAQKETGVAVADAIANGEVTRAELFITSKVPQTE